MLEEHRDNRNYYRPQSDLAYVDQVEYILKRRSYP